MSLQIRRLHLRVSTEGGLYGSRLDFDDGLVVFRGPNSAGKSTCLQGILYALGLEGMLGPSRDIPMPHAVHDYLDTGDGNTAKVLESEVLLEIASGEDYLTVRRPIKGEDSRSLVTVWEGAALSGRSGAGTGKDYWVRDPGAAQRMRGFHRLLEEFVGWELPTVPQYQGDDTKLYLEGIFPLLYVEQKKGWSPMQGRYPTYLGIRELSMRALEFLLALDAYDISGRKAALRERERVLRAQWQDKREEIDSVAGVVDGVVEGIPGRPTGEWPPEVEPQLLLPRDGEWKSFDDTVAELREEAARLEEEEIPRVEEVADELQKRLNQRQEELQEEQARADRLLEEVETEENEIGKIEERLEANREDLEHYKDILKLRRLGSDEKFTLSVERCPTCHQDVPDSLLPLDGPHKPMAVEENVEFLKEQEQVYEMMLSTARQGLNAKRRDLRQSVSSLNEVRGEIRSLKSSLVQDARQPSIEAIRRRVRVEEKLDALLDAKEKLDQEINYFAQAADEWRDIQQAKERLPSGVLSESDRAKLDAFEDRFIQLLEDFAFKSIAPGEIELSKNSYKPEYEGMDLQFDLSASDTIRGAWAYRIGLLDVGREFETNHPGLIIFDEPKQQDVAESSVREFFEKASRSTDHGGQVIVATSDLREEVEEKLDGIEHQLINVSEGERVLKKL